MRLPLPVLDLHDTIKGFGHVVTPDERLNSALNALAINKMAPFALTPEELALRYRSHELSAPPVTPEDIVITINHRHDIPIPRAHRTVTRILDYWNRNGRLPRTMEDRLDRKILSEIKESSLPHQLFYSPLNPDTDIAVISPDLLSPLQRNILPPSYSKIEALEDRDAEGTAWYAFESERELIRNVRNICDEHGAHDCAIIIHPESPLRPLIISSLLQDNHPISCTDERDFDTRLFLKMLSLKPRIRSVRVRDIASIVNQLGYPIERTYLNHRLISYIEHDQNLATFVRRVERCKTFSDLLSLFVSHNGGQNETGTILNRMGYGNILITERTIMDVQFYAQHMREERDRGGVLFADPTRDRWINRGTCLYVRPDASWTRNEYDENLRGDSFRILMSQGNTRIYMAPALRSGEDVLPSPYFNVVFDEAIHSFDDVARAMGSNLIPIRGERPPRETTFAGEGESSGDAPTHFSQSRLSTFYLCPKRYSYSLLVQDIDMIALKKGTLLHDFAAFYASHPDVVKEKGIEPFADMMVEECARIIDEQDFATYRTMFHIGILNAMTFIDSLSLEAPGIPASGTQENFFANKLDMDAHHDNTEVMFEDDEIGLRGIIDLIINPTQIVDYKTSTTPKRGYQIMRQSLPHLIQDQADFQAIAYLTELRRYKTDTELVFEYYYLLADQKDRIHGTSDESRRRVTVTYKPMAFASFITSEEGFRLLGTTQRAQRFISLVGKDTLKGFLRSYPVPEAYQFSPERLARSPYARQFVQHIKENLTFSLSTVEQDSLSFISQVAYIRTGRRGAFFFKEDLDQFEGLLRSAHQKNSSYARAQYPYRPIRKTICKQCEFKDMCLRRYDDDIR